MLNHRARSLPMSRCLHFLCLHSPAAAAPLRCNIVPQGEVLQRIGRVCPLKDVLSFSVESGESCRRRICFVLIQTHSVCTSDGASLTVVWTKDTSGFSSLYFGLAFTSRCNTTSVCTSNYNTVLSLSPFFPLRCNTHPADIPVPHACVQCNVFELSSLTDKNK